VTEIPGTTRDAVEAHAVLEGFPFRLVDTAGLRESDDRVERLGIEVSRKYLAAADLVLFCRDAGCETRIRSLRNSGLMSRTSGRSDDEDRSHRPPDQPIDRRPQRVRRDGRGPRGAAS